MADEPQYFDVDGNPVSLHRLCRLEPEWAANRVRVGLSEDAGRALLEQKP